MSVSSTVSPKGGGLAARLLKSRELSVVAVLFVLFAVMFFSSARDSFFGRGNVYNVLQQVALLSLFAIGETIVIITSGIDLSLGSLIAFAGMLTALFLVKFAAVLVLGPAILLAILCALLISLLIGVFHASLIHKLKLPPFVVTLAALLVLRSQAAVLNGQLPITIAQFPEFIKLANIDPAKGTPWLGIILVLVVVVTHVLLTKTRIGRYLYAVGSNEQATRLSGVNVYKVKLFAYGASALLGGLAGVLFCAYSEQGTPNFAQGYELDAVAASVLGGASLSGGRGSVLGTLLGAVLLNTILSAINLTPWLSKPDIWRGTIVGGVLFFAVLVTALQQKGSSE